MTVKCINCGRIKTVEKAFDDLYRCKHCGILFDDDPDEGGTHGKYPDQRALRNEKQQQRRLGRNY